MPSIELIRFKILINIEWENSPIKILILIDILPKAANSYSLRRSADSNSNKHANACGIHSNQYGQLSTCSLSILLISIDIEECPRV